jgi:hypothetical protein
MHERKRLSYSADGTPILKKENETGQKETTNSPAKKNQSENGSNNVDQNKSDH